MRRRYKKRKTYKKRMWKLFVACIIAIGGYIGVEYHQQTYSAIDIEDIPEYSGEAYVVINDNVPYFDENDLTTETFEKYSPLDFLGRCGVAFANVSEDTMPTKERESIGMIKPSGWQIKKYDFVDGKLVPNLFHKGEELRSMSGSETSIREHGQILVTNLIAAACDRIAEHMPAAWSRKRLLSLWRLAPQMIRAAADIIVNESMNTMIRRPFQPDTAISTHFHMEHPVQ